MNNQTIPFPATANRLYTAISFARLQRNSGGLQTAAFLPAIRTWPRFGWLRDSRRIPILLPILFLLVLPWAAYAGQSIFLPNATSVNFSDPSYPVDSDWRAEMFLDAWAPGDGGTSTIIHSQGIGALALIINSQVWVYDTRNTYAGSSMGNSAGFQQCRFSLIGRGGVLLRWQRKGNELFCEMWNVDGSGYQQQFLTRTATGNTSSGGILGNARTSWGGVNLAFFRVHDSVLDAGAKPPVTVDPGIRGWRFDGDGSAETGGNNINTSVFSFSSTNPGPGIVSIPAQAGKKTWMPFIPLRAGGTSELTSDSFTLSDSSAELTCFWQQISGPSKLQWTGRNTCRPSISGAVFGQYTVRLRVTDVDGRVAAKDYDVGAVAYDDNGVVIYPDERLYSLLGPMVAYGQSPWEFEDERHTVMTAANWNKYELFGGLWSNDHYMDTVNGTPRLGTAWREAGTRILGVNTNFLEVFCGGRPGPSWTSNAAVANIHLKSISGFRSYVVRACVSDTEVTINNDDIASAPATAPGGEWHSMGIRALSFKDTEGTVYINPAVNPRKLFGVGTNMQTLLCGGGTTPILSNRIWAFGVGFSADYAIASCESETEITLSADWTQEAIGNPGVTWGYRKAGDYGSWTKSGNASSYVNFYDGALSYLRLHYRSGWKKPLDAGRWLIERTWTLPLFDSRNTSPLSMIWLHKFDDKPSLFKDEDRMWIMLRNATDVFAASGIDSPFGRTIGDTRESAYGMHVWSMIAQYHPDALVRATYRTRIASYYNNVVSWSQDPAGFFPTRIWTDATRTLNRVWIFANGSDVATLHSGADLPADLCGDPSTFYSEGTVSVEKGGMTLTGTGTNWTGIPNTSYIYLRGTLNGLPYSQVSRVAASTTPTANSIALRFAWPGDTNSITEYRIQATPERYWGTYPATSEGKWLHQGQERLDGIPENDNWYWCTVTSPTTVRLDKPFTGDTSGGNIYRRFMRGIPGYYQIAFMNGLLAEAFFRIARIPEMDPAIVEGYRNAGFRLMDYVRNISKPYGLGGLPWVGGASPICHPAESRPNPCDAGPISTTSLDINRSFGIESVWGISSDYLAGPTPEKRQAGDAWHTALLDQKRFVAPFPGDQTPAEVLTGWIYGNITLTKFLGQSFGMGGMNTWAAARVGGASAPVTRQSLVNFSLAEIPGATQFRVLTYFPSGEVRSTVCTASPCTVTVDERQGNHWILKQYLNANGDVVAESARDLLRLQ